MSLNPVPYVSITNDQLYAEIVGLRGDVRGALLRIEAADAKAAAAAVDVADHETRLRLVEAAVPGQLAVRLAALERWQWRATGIVVGVAGVAGLLAGWLGSVLARVH